METKCPTITGSVYLILLIITFDENDSENDHLQAKVLALEVLLAYGKVLLTV